MLRIACEAHFCLFLLLTHTDVKLFRICWFEYKNRVKQGSEKVLFWLPSIPRIVWKLIFYEYFQIFNLYYFLNLIVRKISLILQHLKGLILWSNIVVFNF